MRRLGTSLVVGGVLVLAGLAAADAFRGGGHRAVVQPTTPVHPQGRPTLASSLRRDSIAGRLTYSDPGCRLRTILLPSLQRDRVRSERTGTGLRLCNFSLAAGHFLPGRHAVASDGSTVASCSKGRVIVRNVVSKAVLARAKGCPVAWRRLAQGASQLTRFQGGEIVADHHVLVSRADLVRAARKHPNLVGLARDIPVRVVVPEYAWLDQRRVAAILRIIVPGAEGQQMLALLDRGRLIGIDVRFDGLMRRLATSPQSNYVAVEPGTLMSADGRSWELPRTLQNGLVTVFGFSPDERWLAVGTRASVYLVSVVDLERSEPEPRVDKVPITATDLVWEPGGVVTDTSKAG